MDSRANPALVKVALALESLKIIFFVYLFLLSIELMGDSFKLFGAGFTHFLDMAVSDPLTGLVVGVVVTSMVQSSSMTTSIVVAMVGAGSMSLQHAVPIIMGSNIGTTVTNTIVSFAYLGRKKEFEPSFGASIVHDMFNIFAVLLFFPLQVATGFLEKSAIFLSGLFEGIGGLTFASPLKYIIAPVGDRIGELVPHGVILLIISFAALFFALTQIVKSMKGIVMQRVERTLNQYLFRNTLISLLFGLALTATIQSSSIATSLVVPLVAAGMLTIEQIFPYTLGSNLGTTITAMLAALSIGKEAAMTVAFTHLLFNIYGISVFLPLRRIPIWAAKSIASFAAVSKRNFFIFLALYMMLHTVIILIVFL